MKKVCVGGGVNATTNFSLVTVFPKHPPDPRLTDAGHIVPPSAPLFPSLCSQHCPISPGCSPAPAVPAVPIATQEKAERKKKDEVEKKKGGGKVSRKESVKRKKTRARKGFKLLRRNRRRRVDEPLVGSR